MKIPHAHIKRFQRLWREYAQEDLDDKEAYQRLRELVTLIRNSFATDYQSQPSPYHDPKNTS